MKYNEFKKARDFSSKEENKPLLEKISSCEQLLDTCKWLKENKNADADGRPLYKATISLNIHEPNQKGKEKTVSYETNFDYLEKKANEVYEQLIRQFEEGTD